MKKERYKLHKSKKNFIKIYDQKIGSWIREDTICDALNIYDEQVKELKTEVPTLFVKTLQEKIWKVLREENQELKEKLNSFETLMKKYNVEDIEHLDLMLFVLSGETKYHLKEIKDKHKKELEQLQNQKAITELEKTKENAWQSATDISLLLDYIELARIIDYQIKSLKGGEE